MQNKKEIQDYLNAKVNPIFQQVLVDIIKSKPKNILNFCKTWFQKKIEIQSQTQNLISLDSQSDSDEQPLNEAILQNIKLKPKWYRQRKAICGQIYGAYNKAQDFELTSIIKKPSVNNRILFRLKSLFLFKDFDDQDISKLISAMSQQVYQQKAIIIRQGDEGDSIYIVDEGQLHCYRTTQDSEVYLKTIVQGQMFGQISMLYKSKRTASIRAKTKATLFKLDRTTFNIVIRQRNLKKRKTVLQIIKKIDIFKQLEQEERFQIQDIVKQMPAHLNQYILKQGKKSNKLFMVESGKLIALKKQKNGHQKITANYNQGDFFGLNSLINKDASSISVMALTNAKLYYLEEDALERVIGPIHKILHRNIDIYSKYNNDK